MQKEYAKVLVPEWEREHPNATQQQCADALGISRRRVAEFTSKKVKIRPEEAKKKVWDWFDKNPNGTQKRCVEELKLSPICVSKYLQLWKLKKEIESK